MASRAFPRGRFIEHDSLTLNGSESRVTKIAGDLLVGALQREIALLFVIEMRGLPLIHAVACLAGCGNRVDYELCRVRIFVAFRAFRGSGFKHDLADLAFRAGLVTLVALHFGVCAKEGKRSL